MAHTRNRRIHQRAWRVFSRRDGDLIARDLHRGAAPHCPLCAEILEARAATRCAPALPLGAWGFDLDCRSCRRFWVVVRHTPRSRRIIRMRRFIAAVRSVDVDVPEEAAAPAAESVPAAPAAVAST